MEDSCSSVSKLLEKYFDLEVMGEERLLVEYHLRDCLACRNALRSMEELRTLIKVPVEEAVRKEEFPWLLQKIEREVHCRQEKRPGGKPFDPGLISPLSLKRRFGFLQRPQLLSFSSLRPKLSFKNLFRIQMRLLSITSKVRPTM